MIKKRDLWKNDWYKILNESLKNVKVDFDKINYKSHKILNEQEKFNKINLINSSLDNKYQVKNDIKEQSEIKFKNQKEKFFVKRLNLNNYKTKNHLVNVDTLFLKDILEKIDKFNAKKLYKEKYKSIKEEHMNLSQKTFSNKLMNLSTNTKKRVTKSLTKSKIEAKKINLKYNNNSLSKTFNDFNDDKSIFGINNSYYPIIKNKQTEKSKIMKMLLIEENKSVNRANSISNKILKLNQDFMKNKRFIFGYNDKEEDFIVINNKKIFQINPEKKFNKKFQKNFSNIKRIKDIEQKLLNDNDKIFNKTKKDLILRYRLKKKKINNYFNNENE